MKSSLLCTMIFFAIVGYPMDGEESSQGPLIESEEPYYDLTSLVHREEPLLEIDVKDMKAALEQLSLQVEAYYLYLTKVFGCVVCQGVNAVFNAKAYEHTKVRKGQLELLKAVLANADKERMSQFLNLLTMLTFKGTVGNSFKVSCLAAFQLHCPTLLNREPNEPCIICLERPRAIHVEPCNHLAYCRECVEKHNKLTQSCSWCRAAINSITNVENKVLDFCVRCMSKGANMMGKECGHIALCEACCAIPQEMSCSICLLGNQKFIKIFR